MIFTPVLSYIISNRTKSRGCISGTHRLPRGPESCLLPLSSKEQFKNSYYICTKDPTLH